MNPRLRYLTMFLIVILCMAVMTSDANAKTVPKGEVTKKVIRDKICGDEICSSAQKIKTPPQVMKEKIKQMEKEIEKKIIKKIQREKKE